MLIAIVESMTPDRRSLRSGGRVRPVLPALEPHLHFHLPDLDGGQRLHVAASALRGLVVALR